MAKRKYKTFKYDDEEREMFDDTVEAFMLRLKRNPVPNGKASWLTVIHDTQKHKFSRRKKNEKNRYITGTGKNRKKRTRC